MKIILNSINFLIYEAKIIIQILILKNDIVNNAKTIFSESDLLEA